MFCWVQARALRQGLDVLVGTPGRVIDHINRGNLDLSHCDVAVLDEADEMLNMGFAEDVETILNGIGSANDEKTQCLLFSATTPSWVKRIGAQYQDNVYNIDATGNEGARVVTTVTHKAIQLPPGIEAKKQALEDIIAVEISRNIDDADSDNEDFADNPIAAAAHAKKKKSGSAMQQKIFGKTIVFTETKREADELVSGAIFKTLSAQVRMNFTIQPRAADCLGSKKYLTLFFSFSQCFCYRQFTAMLDRNSAMQPSMPFAREPSTSWWQLM